MLNLQQRLILSLITSLLLIFFPTTLGTVYATTGDVVTWGWNGNGQLGNGIESDEAIFPPVKINLSNVISIDAATHSIALKSDGTVWAWGDNSYGQLGDGTSINKPSPIKVKDSNDPTGFLNNITDISTTYYNSLALKSNGKVLIWGFYVWGEWIEGQAPNNLLPVSIKESNNSDLSNVIAIAGDNLALKSDGTVWEWGDFETALPPTYKAVQVKGPSGQGVLSGIIAIAAGENHNLALKSDGTVWAWGYNGNGQLGVGTIDFDYHYPEQVMNLTGVKSIAAGNIHSLALKSDGTVWAWGHNFSGQLGNGDTTGISYDIPNQVKDSAGTGILDDVNIISGKGDESIAITKDGNVWIWGANPKQILADDYTSTFTYLPLKISELKGAISVHSGGVGHSIALMPITGTKLNVPLLKQGIKPFNNNDPIWESQIFDHAEAGQFDCGKTMAQCGCSTTSIAMVFKYYGINKLPDGTNLDPGTLNTWLKNNNGYNRNAGVKWATAATLAYKAKSQNPNFAYNSLEFDDNISFSTTRLTNDLENKMPIILHVNSPGMHFVVATGKENNVFTINDPLFPKTTLAQYSTSPVSVRKYKPAFSDMSYITYEVDPNVDIEVKDANGNIVGESYLEYSPAQLTEEPFNFESSAIKVFYFAKPDTGNYTIKLSSNNSQSYQLDETFITQDGDIKTETFKGFLNNSLPAGFTISFDKQLIENSKTEQVVTYQTLINDIHKLYELGEITSDNVYNGLVAKAETSEKLSNQATQNAAVATLKTIQSELEREKGKNITKNAYQILYKDTEYLIKNYKVN